MGSFFRSTVVGCSHLSMCQKPRETVIYAGLLGSDTVGAQLSLGPVCSVPRCGHAASGTEKAKEVLGVKSA